MRLFPALLLGLFGPSQALSIRASSAFRLSRVSVPHAVAATVWDLRGGDQDDPGVVDEDPVDYEQDLDSDSVVDAIKPEKSPRLSLSLAPMASALASLGRAYSASLEKRPIITKSVTASCVFALSDWLAQRVETSKEKKETNWTRTISSALVGLLYFGPAAHAWYDMIFRILPSTTLASTLQKAALGQIFFGPSFTCIFFATSLLQQGTFSLRNWWNKIRSDLPGACLAGIGFWPIVDVVSYSMIPTKWIPLFINACSLVWTIYLSVVANRQAIRE